MNLIAMRSRLRSLFRLLGSRNYIGYGPMSDDAKKNALVRVFLSDAPIIETGTYLGGTSRKFAKLGYEVHTIEVSQKLSDAAFPMLNAIGVNCYCGDSGVLLPQIMQKIFASGRDKANFWLDGHWSGGITSRAEDYETPIVSELNSIAAFLPQFGSVVIAIDDIRYFGNDPSYPSKRYLIDWAEAHSLHFYFLADIFVASTETFSDL
ncbi:MAG: hypothetical protein ACHP8A_13780 [Terriglobales bacterium]